ncbi:MAG: DNA mismatch repair endonuclease MutL [Candidatus Babeliales bacterium]
MGKIYQLPPHEAQKIAAGEVIERPVNALKELIENSIDADARTITIYLEHGGHALIRVIDDGSGMDEADAHHCFAHHATSKITRVEDVAQLATFGFRGEALTSIDAVSKLTLITKTDQTSTAIQIMRNAGELVACNTVASQTGTDLAIHDLFFNVPARKKFLKTVDTEMRACMQLFYAYCFAYPSIHFTLHSNNKELYNCPRTDSMLTRAQQLWPDQDNEALLVCTAQDKEITLDGFISPPHMHKYDRSHFFFFVNHRWVKNPQLIKAVLKGYAGILPPERYPFGALNITIDPELVDINIHPRKQEVQFLHPRRIETCISSTVKQQLENYTKRHVQNPHSMPMTNFPSTAPHPYTPPLHTPWPMSAWSASANAGAHPEDAVNQISATHQTVHMSSDMITPQSLAMSARPEPSSQNRITHEQQEVATAEQETHIIGQLFTTYIMAQHADCLVLIDQHAAHERIIYERIRARFGSIASVPLLFAQPVHMEQHILDALEPYAELCASFGLIIERMSIDLLHIIATPVHTQTVDYAALVHDIAAYIVAHHTLEPALLHQKIHEHTHAQMACKAAVKAGDLLSMTQMQQIMTDLFATEHCATCPHGRPTIWRISQYEIEKKFKRVG